MSRISAVQEFDSTRERLMLDGEWEFCYDTENNGAERGLNGGGIPLPESIQIPGCPQASEFETRCNPDKNSFGNLSGILKYPSTDPCWYRKEFYVKLTEDRVWLHLGGVTPAAEVWINGVSLGETRSSRSAVRCDITDCVRPGELNTLVIRVFVPEGPMLSGMFEAYYSYFGWTGMYRSVWIEYTADTYVSAVHIMTEIDEPYARIAVRLRNNTNKQKTEKVYDGAGVHDVTTNTAFAPVTIRCCVKGETQNYTVETVVTAAENQISCALLKLPMPGAKLWSPGSPNLYNAEITLITSEGELDSVSVRFGLREIRTVGNKIYLNNKPIWLIGGSDMHIYMETVMPPADKQYHAAHIAKMKRYGFNYVKGCIEVFPEEYLKAADELGLMVCQEFPLGLTGTIRTETIYNPTPEFKEFWLQEVENMVCFDRHHPCVIAYAMTSEKPPTLNSFALIHQTLPSLARNLNPGALIYDVTHTGGEHSVYTMFGKRDTDLIEECPANPYDLAPLVDKLEQPEWGKDRVLPWILHEYNWWTSLPNPKIKPKYDGKVFRLSGVAEFERVAEEKGFTSAEIEQFVEHSEKLVVLLRKEGLEIARRHPGIAGYHFWMLTNYFAIIPEGLFDEFWDDQMGVTADDFIEYNADTVLLLDGDRRCFTQGVPLEFDILISHYGESEIPNATLEWNEGEIKIDNIKCGSLEPHRICFTPRLDVLPYETEFELVLKTSDGTVVSRNHWKLWFYPKPKNGEWETLISTEIGYVREQYPGMVATGGVLLTETLDDTALEVLENGGNVVLLSCGALPEYRFDPKYNWGFANLNAKSYRTPPWNNGGHGNSGTVVNEHPALGGFPHHGWCDLNFVWLIDEVYPLVLEHYGFRSIEPIIRSIGHFQTMTDKAYLFEIQVGEGRLLATSLNIKGTFADHPETRYLLYSMLKYAAGGDFKPKTQIDIDVLKQAIAIKDDYYA